MNVSVWLRGFRLGKYEAVFRENAIDAENAFASQIIPVLF
jgi:hypothetical protein